MPLEFAIGDSFDFLFALKNPLTGAAADADSTPTYRVYADGTDAPLLTAQNCAKRDDAGTTGLYTASTGMMPIS